MLKKIAVVMGGASPEHDISLESGKAVLEALDQRFYRGRAAVISRKGMWQVCSVGSDIQGREALYENPVSPETAADILREWGIDAAFLALHGPNGEDGSIQGFFRTLEIPYTASGIRASSLAMDKALTKALVANDSFFVEKEIRTPPFLVFTLRKWRSGCCEIAEDAVRRIGMPCFVKPVRSGSSVGVFFVDCPEKLENAVNEAFRADSEVMVETAVPGREITCAVLGNAGGKLEALPLVEIKPVESSFFDYDAKYVPGKANEICPAGLDDVQAGKIEKAALSIHEKIGAKGFSRSDFLLNEKGLWFLELNTIPGLTPQSIVPKAAAAAGMGMTELVTMIIKSALAEPEGVK